MAKLTYIVWSPHINSALTINDWSDTTSWYIKVLNLKHLSAFNPMRGVKFAEIAFAPNVELTIRREWRWKRARSHLNHFTERKLLKESRNRASSWRSSACSKLTSRVGTHRVNFTILSQHNCVLISTGHFGYLFRDPCYIVRRHFVGIGAKA